MEQHKAITCLQWKTPGMPGVAFEYFHTFCWLHRPSRWNTWSPNTTIETRELNRSAIFTRNDCPLCGESLYSKHGNPE